jgi:hypothetical protein
MSTLNGFHPELKKRVEKHVAEMKLLVRQLSQEFNVETVRIQALLGLATDERPRKKKMGPSNYNLFTKQFKVENPTGEK